MTKIIIISFLVIWICSIIFHEIIVDKLQIKINNLSKEISQLKEERAKANEEALKNVVKTKKINANNNKRARNELIDKL